MIYSSSEVKLLGLLTLALWSDEFHALATFFYSQRELPPVPTKQEAGWIQSWYRQGDKMKSDPAENQTPLTKSVM
jgi:hypothetical protein